MERVLLDKEELVKYIICKYRDTHVQSPKISPIKLQKSLYFLFAMWGGKVSSSKDGVEVEDDRLCNEFSPYLFDADFEAWKFGPVDKTVWEKYKKGEYESYISDCSTPTLDFANSDEFERNTASEYIEGLLQRIFITSDFGLVDLSHEDKCWKRAYNSANKKIDKDAIINEYASR